VLRARENIFRWILESAGNFSPRRRQKMISRRDVGEPVLLAGISPSHAQRFRIASYRSIYLWNCKVFTGSASLHVLINTARMRELIFQGIHIRDTDCH